ncbi:MAG: glycosyltransferase [Phycisphaerales bacterium]|jgi:spore maturation protein CgeB|nr:glycosyltransferase [Phycisphaerales bacterium]
MSFRYIGSNWFSHPFIPEAGLMIQQSNIRRVLMVHRSHSGKPRSCQVESRYWAKGLIQNGIDVQLVCYESILRSRSNSGLLSKFKGYDAYRYADQCLGKVIDAYRPDLVLVFCRRILGPKTIQTIRTFAPGVPIVGRDIDAWPNTSSERTYIGAECDKMIVTDAGDWMEHYSQIGVPHVAFFPVPCDPDIHRPYPRNPKLGADVLFTGKLNHSGGCDPDRLDILHRLKTFPNGKLYGTFDKNTIYGIQCYEAYSNSKIVLSINAENNISRYHSDRLTAAVSCGSLVLAKEVPQSELLFRDREHLRYFKDADHFFELVEYYLRKEEERDSISLAGMHHCHKEFNPARMARLLLDFVTTDTYDADWGRVL